MAEFDKYTYLFKRSLSPLLVLVLILSSAFKGSIFAVSFYVPLYLLVYGFYKSINSPSGTNRAVIVIFAIIHDSLFNMPLGITALLLLPIVFFLETQRKYIKEFTFALTWLSFALLSLIYVCLQWYIVYLWRGDTFTFSVLAQSFTTILIYPFMHFIFYVIDKSLKASRLSIL